MQIIKAQNLSESVKLGIVVARYNEEITSALLDGALTRARELDVAEEDITAVWVPGAVEVPYIAASFARKDDIDAIITFAAVVEGETYHAKYVCEQVTRGCNEVMLRYHKPVIFGVLTTENLAQAKERIGGKKGHMGREALDAAFEMVSVSRQLAH